ncbi:hypothetical protein BD779DRAFT_1676380 [Infundibulicybe gibba]|nr:hypothetical protein BD779DRAFT_1676380 [Infundibulicybe gibba]
MAGNQITVSSARRSNRAKGSDKAEMGACEACRTPMLLASVPRHFETACEMNPNRQWHKCHKCPRGFTRKDALKRHLAAPQACSGSKQAATSPESGASPGPSRPARTRTSRRTVPYAPSPASSSSSSSSRRRRRGRYSSGSPESAISSATSASPPVPFITGLAPVEEFQNRTRPSPIINASAFGRNPQPASNPIGPVAQSSAGMGQHNRYFENPHFLIPAEGFSQISQVPPLPYYLHTSLEPHINATLPQTVPGVHFDDSWGASSLTEALLINPVPQPHGDWEPRFTVPRLGSQLKTKDIRKPLTNPSSPLRATITRFQRKNSPPWFSRNLFTLSTTTRESKWRSMCNLLPAACNTLTLPMTTTDFR